MRKEKIQFLVDEFQMFSVMAALARSKSYNSNATDQRRKDLKKKLREKLKKLASQYRNRIDDNTHICNIKKLASEITREFHDILQDRCFRIACAHKALNLYLKYLWCIGVIMEPPHCPFDNFIISNVRRYEYQGPNWTEIKELKEYKNLVQYARKAADNESLAKWELRLYNENRNRLNDP